MLNNVSRRWLLSSWFTVVAIMVLWSMAVGARLSTSGLLLVLGIAPGLVMAIMGIGAPAPTVAEILRSVNAPDKRL
jgi:hypothetical protein